MLTFWSILLVISIKIKGSHLAYILFWIIFFLPAIIHYELVKKFLFKFLPLLQQLDHSMQYERRSILDKSELLVDVKLPKSEYDEDYEEESEFIRELTEREKRVIENLESEEEEEEEEYVDHEDIEIEQVEERYLDQENLENVQRIRTIEYRVKISPNNFINKVEESLMEDSLLPNESLPNIDSSHESDENNYNFDKNEEIVPRRRVKYRPSLKDCYGDEIDFKNRSEPVNESYMDKDGKSTVRMTKNKKQKSHEQELDETFDFLDEEY